MSTRVAVRRAELERQQQYEKVAVEEQKQAAHEADMGFVLNELSPQAAADGATLKREGDGLALIEEMTPLTDVEAMEQSEVQRLFKSESRKRWTPKENWMFIGPMCVGLIALVLNPVIGILILGFGFWRMTVSNEKHDMVVHAQYPSLFENVKLRKSLKLF
jgi:hypothetical protein